MTITKSLGSILLSPRRTATGSPAGNALENINTAVISDGALCYVETGVGKGTWQFQRDSTETPNSTNVVAPISGPGRWILKIVSSVNTGSIVESGYLSQLIKDSVPGLAVGINIPYDMLVRKVTVRHGVGTAAGLNVQFGIYDGPFAGADLIVPTDPVEVPVTTDFHTYEFQNPVALSAGQKIAVAGVVDGAGTLEWSVQNIASSAGEFIHGLNPQPIPDPLVDDFTTTSALWCELSG